MAWLISPCKIIVCLLPRVVPDLLSWTAISGSTSSFLRCLFSCEGPFEPISLRRRNRKNIIVELVKVPSALGVRKTFRMAFRRRLKGKTPPAGWELISEVNSSGPTYDLLP